MLYNFELLRPGDNAPYDKQNADFRDIEEVKVHCRELFDRPREPIKAVLVRQDGGPVIYSVARGRLAPC